MPSVIFLVQPATRPTSNCEVAKDNTIGADLSTSTTTSTTRTSFRNEPQVSTAHLQSPHSHRTSLGVSCETSQAIDPYDLAALQLPLFLCVVALSQAFGLPLFKRVIRFVAHSAASSCVLRFFASSCSFLTLTSMPMPFSSSNCIIVLFSGRRLRNRLRFST